MLTFQMVSLPQPMYGFAPWLRLNRFNHLFVHIILKCEILINLILRIEAT